MKKLKISYDSPVVLNYAILSFWVLILGYIFPFLQDSFVLNPEKFKVFNITTWFPIISHAIGHADFAHYIGNFSLLLLLAPGLEKKYGSSNILMMFILTALFTGILHLLLFTGGVLGASGNVFMIIILSSFSTVKDDGKIPFTLIVVSCLYFGKEIVSSFSPDNIYHFGHIIGGVCGGIFGWILNKK